MRRSSDVGGSPLTGGRAYVFRISNPPTEREQLQLAVAHLQGAAVVLVPRPCETAEEWVTRYAPTQSR